jgi:hypothetical protein
MQAVMLTTLIAYLPKIPFILLATRLMDRYSLG